MPTLVADTVSKDEPFFFSSVTFGKYIVFSLFTRKIQYTAVVLLLIYSFIENVIFEKSLNIGGRLNGLKIPDDLILRESDTIQTFNGPLTFASDVNVFGTLTVGNLNGVNLQKKCELFEPPPNALPQKLIIAGKMAI